MGVHLRAAAPSEDGVSRLLVSIVGCIVYNQGADTVCDSVSMILVKDSAPDPSSLGATNGLAQFAMVRLSSVCFVSHDLTHLIFPPIVLRTRF